MLDLPNVTLLCVETREPELAHWAIQRCLNEVEFAKVVLATNLDLVINRKPGLHYVQAPAIKTTKDYSDFLLTDIGQYVKGTHVLIIQWDSFVLHPELWTSEFLNYDYIGPAWPHHPENPVGNGGFSLRSVKLLEDIKKPGFTKKHPEDYCICVDNKVFLEQQCDIKIASMHIAEQFAVERTAWHDAFGFHGFFNFGRVLDDSDLEEFLKILPKYVLSGVDTYDLISNLREQGRIPLAKKIAQNVRFSWKVRKRYLKLKLWLFITGCL
jgi:hypothetical protein